MKAFYSYLKDAERISNKGEIALELGKLYLEEHSWHMAIKYFQKALEKGVLENQAEVHSLIERCHCLTARNFGQE